MMKTSKFAIAAALCAVFFPAWSYADQEITITRDQANQFADTIKQTVENLPPDTKMDGIRVDSVNQDGIPTRASPENPTYTNDMVPEGRADDGGRGDE